MKVKANAVKQEYEKQDELKRSALRALGALANIPKAGKYAVFFLNSNDSIYSQNIFNINVDFSSFADKNLQLADFLKYIQNTPELQTVYQAVQKDTINASNSNASNSVDNSMDHS